MQCSVETRGSIVETRGVGDLMFILELVEKYQRSDGGFRRKEADVKQVIRPDIDGPNSWNYSSLIQTMVSSIATWFFEQDHPSAVGQPSTPNNGQWFECSDCVYEALSRFVYGAGR